MLKTKLNKPIPTSKLIYRKELIEKLESGKEKKLTLVSAPAGYGKSTTIIQWTDQCNLSYSWYSLDKSDNDIITFLQYLIAGLQAKYKNLGLRALKLLALNSKSSFESIATFLINDFIEIEENFHIVLDDYHLIENGEINKLLSFLLENLPANIQIVLITRSDPSIPLARLRSQQQVTDIRASDLCFNSNYIYDFFKKSLNIKISIEDAEILETKTEGWIAGLQLAGLSIQAQEDVSGFVEKLKGDNRYIMDYLIEEVLHQQSQERRDFLLCTSILKRFNASLCNFIFDSNNSQKIIEELEGNNMFIVPLDSERKWYRYHHLFEQLLLNRLAGKNDNSLVLHKKASTCYESKGMIEDAIQHSFKINDYQRSLELINTISSQLWSEGKHGSIIEYGELLPDEEIYKSPEFSLYYSWVLVHSGQGPKAAPYLNKAEIVINENLKKKPDSKELLELKGRIAVAQGFLQSMTSNFEKFEKYSGIAMKYLTEEDPLWFSWAWSTKGFKEMVQGNLSEAINSLKIGIDYAKKSGNIYLVATTALRLAYSEWQLGLYVSMFRNCNELLDYIHSQGYSELTKIDWIYSGLHTTLTLIHYMWGDFDKAEEHIKIGYELSLKESNITNQFLGLYLYSIVYRGKYNWNECLKKLNELEELMHRNTIPPHLLVLYQSWKGHILIETEEAEKIMAFFQKNNIGSETEINNQNEKAFIPFVHYLLTIGDITEAEMVLSKIKQLAIKNNRKDRISEIQVIYSILYERLNDSEKANQCMLRALEVASGEKIMVYFLYYFDEIKDLLQNIFKILATRKHDIPEEYIEKLKILIAKHEKANKNLDKSDISTRELETLKLIAENLTNQNIADEMYISINTVKTHIKNILLKLDAKNRSEAILKAKENGLLLP